ncbi:MAG TPA: Hpt domain-containing protein [Thermoanaerobaculia bacterium]|nr:Hpt domain-containing protein [Thermoanaerobaculia bacterium]
MDFEFDELKKEFLIEAEGKVREIVEFLKAEQLDKAALDRISYLAHQLKGAGGSYGFSMISTEAAALESGVEQFSHGAGDLDGARTRGANLSTIVAERTRELDERLAHR